MDTNGWYQAIFLDERAAALLSAALRVNRSRSLTELTIEQPYLGDNNDDGDGGDGDGTVLAVMLDALVGHPCLRTLTVRCDVPQQGCRVVGAALAALLADGTPALQELDIASCGLGDIGMGPLFDALPHNTHLHTLHCDWNNISLAFAAGRVLPAVQANTSLRKFCAVSRWPGGREDAHPGLVAAVALVQARAAADA